MLFIYVASLYVLTSAQFTVGTDDWLPPRVKYVIDCKNATFKYIETKNETDLDVLDKYEWPLESVELTAFCARLKNIPCLEVGDKSFAKMMRLFIEENGITSGYQRSRRISYGKPIDSVNEEFFVKTTWNFKKETLEVSCDLHFSFLKTRKYTVDIQCKKII